MSRRASLLVLVALLLVSVVSAGAGTVSIPYSFSPNTTIQSSQMNSNFATIYNEFNGNIGDANVLTLSESKTTFTGSGHDHSGGTKGAFVAMPVVNGRLALASATSIKFSPYQGNRLYIKKSGTWTAITIASGGITAANTSIFIDGTGGQNLAANTLYYVYLFDNAGTTTVDYSTTSHSTDTTTGMEIKTGVDTRVLVGMVQTNVSSQFDDSTTYRGVLSYYNRRTINLRGTFTADRNTTSSSYVELNSEIQLRFLTWADEAVQTSFTGSVASSAALTAGSAVGYDGTTGEPGFETANTFAAAVAAGNIGTAGVKNGLAEGFHSATLLGKVSAGTGTWSSATDGTHAKVHLHTAIRG